MILTGIVRAQVVADRAVAREPLDAGLADGLEVHLALLQLREVFLLFLFDVVLDLFLELRLFLTDGVARGIVCGLAVAAGAAADCAATLTTYSRRASSPARATPAFQQAAL